MLDLANRTPADHRLACQFRIRPDWFVVQPGKVPVITRAGRKDGNCRIRSFPTSKHKTGWPAHISLADHPAPTTAVSTADD